MLPEKISYERDFPLDISFCEITEYPLHYHHDIEILVVLQGEIELKNGSCRYILPEGSIFANNGREVHGLYSTGKENTIAVLHIDNAYFSQHFPYLSKSSYRTFAKKENDDRFDKLRETVLGILSLYLKKGIDYKQQCIDECISLIDFLNKNFNLFSFDGDLVVSPTYGNLLLIERMSRIIPYIYEHHAEKITLDDLAGIEHLSTYYISHMIKTCTGLSFREFLAFARVEFSEMYLLQTDKKVNTIAKIVGFSTTSYYEKFFRRWFGMSPEEHRSEYTKMVKGPLRPEKVVSVRTSAVLSMVQQKLSELLDKSYNASVRHFNLYVRINAQERPLTVLERNLEIDIYPQDYEKLGITMFSVLKKLRCAKVFMYNEVPVKLKEKFEKEGISISSKEKPTLMNTSRVFGMDSIAGLVYTFQKYLMTSDTVETKLMDDGDETVILKGDNGLLTSSGLFKPAYYAHLMLSRFKGDIISSDKYYAAVRTREDNPSFIISVMNFDDNTSRICSGATTLRDAQQAVENQKDELDINATLYNISGKYTIKKYAFDNTDTLFDFMSKMDFPQNYSSDMDFDLNYYTVPKTDTFTDHIENSLHLNFTLKGTGLQIAVIEPVDIG